MLYVCAMDALSAFIWLFLIALLIGLIKNPINIIILAISIAKVIFYGVVLIIKCIYALCAFVWGIITSPFK
jgi:hypothetical protein